MSLSTIQNNPETGINIVCLIISAAAPALAIGPAVGLPTGAAIALGLFAVIKAQRHSSGTVRRQYYLGAWVIRIFAGCFEQMAYCDQFAQRPTLPFEINATNWAWIATVFMAAIDLWAYQATAAKAAARAEDQAEESSYARVERMQQEKERSETERRKLEMNEKLELARIQADSENRKAAEVARQEAEARKFEAETNRKQAEIEAETKRKQAEENRKRAEERRKEAEIKAEADRKQAEAKRKEAEANRQRAEINRKQAEAQKLHSQAIEAEKAEKKRIEAEAIRKKAEAEADAIRKQAEAEAELKNRWSEASAEIRKALIIEAEIKLTHSLGRKPVQAEIAAELGTTDRTIRNYSKAA